MLDQTIRARRTQKRNTVQKRIIKAVLQNAGRPISPQEILDDAKKTVPSLGMATVYRELRRLQDEREIKQVDIPGDPPRFSAVRTDSSGHHHFKCRTCNRVYTIPIPFEDIATRVPSQFRHESHHVIIFGTCIDGCASATSQQSA